MKPVHVLIVLALVLCLCLVTTVSAQESGCSIDLTDSVLQLLQAQTSAASGDINAGLAQIAEARAALADMISVCSAAGIQAGVLLDNAFVAPNGSFVVDYPSDWVQSSFSQNPSGGGIYFGSSQTAVAALNAPTPELQPGEQAVAVVVGAPELLGATTEDPTLGDVLRAFAAVSMSQFEQVGDLEIASADNRPVGYLQFRGDTFEAVMVGLQLPDSDLYGIVVGVAAPGELDALRPIVEAVTLSAR